MIIAGAVLLLTPPHLGEVVIRGVWWEAGHRKKLCRLYVQINGKNLPICSRV